jgi:hypothetical protein
MNKYITDNPRGGYRFLRGIAPYSSGVVANSGYEIIHVRLASPMSWDAGLAAARRFVESRGLTQQAICAVELRCPKPHSLDGFSDFNQQYRALLEDWDMMVDGQNPVARTNVAPVLNPPDSTTLHAFSFSEPSDITQATVVIAGGGELPRRDLERQHIVRVGETSAEAMREKAECVVGIMRHRLDKLEVADELLTTIDVYTQHSIQHLLEDVLACGLPAIPRLGVNWYYSRPPVEEIEFEMDMRGVMQDLTADLS